MSAPVDVLAVWDVLVASARKNITASEFNAARYAREAMVELMEADARYDTALANLAFAEHHGKPGSIMDSARFIASAAKDRRAVALARCKGESA